MSVHQLRRIAYGIRRDGILTLGIGLARRDIRQHNLKAQFGQEGVPERQQLEHIQPERDADPRSARSALFRIAAQAIHLVLIQIGQIALVAAAEWTLTAVARDKFAVSGEGGNGQRAVVGAQPALDGRCLMRKYLQLIHADQRAGFLCIVLGIQRRTVGTHQSGDSRTGDLASDFQLERAQDGII